MKKVLILCCVTCIVSVSSFSQKKTYDTAHIKKYETLGNQFFSSGNLDSSNYYYHKAASLYKQFAKNQHTTYWEGYCRMQYFIGWNLSMLSQHDKAITIFNEALQTSKEKIGRNHTLTAKLYNGLGVTYREIAEYNKALQFHMKALNILKEISKNPNPDLAGFYNNIANVYFLKTEYDKALQYYLYSLEMWKVIAGDKDPEVAKLYSNIGNTYKSKSEFYKSLEYHLKGLRLKLEIFNDQHLLVAMSYNNIGNLHLQMNQFDSSLFYHSKGLKILKDLYGYDHIYIADALNNIGLSYLNKGNTDSALKYFYNSLKIKKKLLPEKHTSLALSLNNIAKTYRNQYQLHMAMRYYQKSILSLLKNVDTLENITKAPSISDYIDHVELLQAIEGKAEILSVNKNESNLTDNIPALIRQKAALQHYLLCDTIIGKARHEIISKQDKFALGETAKNIYTKAIDLCLHLSKKDEDSLTYYYNLAFYFSERCKNIVLFEAMVSAEAMEFVGIPDKLLIKERALKDKIFLMEKSFYNQKDAKQKALIRKELFNLKNSYDSLIIIFEREYPAYHQLKYGKNFAKIEEIQKKIDKTTSIISYFIKPESIIIFKLTTESIEVFEVLRTDSFELTMENMRKQISNYNNDVNSFSSNSHFLYKTLFPFKIKESTKKLIIIPEGKLSIIPFEALITKNVSFGNKAYHRLPYLIRKKNISYSYSANLLYNTLPQKRTNGVELTSIYDWLAVAPVFKDTTTGKTILRTHEMLRAMDSLMIKESTVHGRLINGKQIVPLPGTEEEVKTIFSFFDNNRKKALVAMHENASEDFIKSGILHKYKYLHFASHGIVNTEKPELSGIILAQDSTSKEDGILHTGEMYNLKLNADLTVLSACETGLGKIKKGEGLIGLTRALLYAGSKNIIVSLWKVADKSTKQLMVDFYADMLENENKPDYAKSLQKAKLKMIAEKKYAHPFYWSPFILIGK